MTSSQTERGHEEPYLRQFTIFKPNRVGQLAELLEAMLAEKVEIAALTSLDFTEYSVLRAVFLEPGKAREVLRRRNAAFTECDVLAVVLEQPDTLRMVCRALLSAELSIQFLYSMMIRRENQAIMVLHTDDPELAAQVLTKHNITLVGREDHDE